MKLPTLIPALLLVSQIHPLFGDQKLHNCNINNRPKDCSNKAYNPVCAYFKEGCPEGLCPKHAANACSACEDETVVSYKNGDCEHTTINCAAALYPAECPDTLFPVCANICLEGNCERTFENDCIACQNVPFSLIKPGACKSDNKKTFCDPENRPSVCTEIYQPVCSYFRENCPDNLCPQTAGNACAACSDPNTVAYTPGECQQDTISCAVVDLPAECPDVYEPVCASSPEPCPAEGCSATFNNLCVACQNAASSLIKPGVCESNSRQFCDPLHRPTDCDGEDGDLVCGYFKEGCPEGLCPQTVINACSACQDVEIVSYQAGQCQEETINCAAASFPEVCPEVWSPVCANVDGTHTTFENACVGCRSAASSLMKPGICLFS